MKNKLFILSFFFISTFAFSQKQIITSEKVKAIGPYSPAVLAGNTMYVSGQIGLHPDSLEIEVDSLDQEIVQAMENVKAILSQAGFDFKDIVSATVYMTDLEEYARMNKVYRKYFPDKNFPARSVVEVGRLPRDANFEISVIAQKEK
ncbi:MAG: RidA family protein [Ignavibacteriales bacterium]|nr:RidA family protein [Ignavibacteriales bacterium]